MNTIVIDGQAYSIATYIELCEFLASERKAGRRAWVQRVDIRDGQTWHKQPSNRRGE